LILLAEIEFIINVRSHFAFCVITVSSASTETLNF